MPVDVPVRYWDEIEQVGRELLPDRVGLIENDRIDGKHWYLAILEEATSIVCARHAALADVA